MRKITVKGQTVEEAIERACQALGVAKERLEIRVVQEPSKGFLGLLSRPAIIEAALNEEEGDSERDGLPVKEKEPLSPEGSLENHIQHDAKQPKEEADQRVQASIDRAVRFLEEVLPKMGLREVQIEVKQDKPPILLQISGKELGLAIGRRGQTLDALQYLTNVVANRGQKEYIQFVLDAENYRERRKKALEQLADRLAKEVIRTREKIALEPMTAAERKIIHTHLQHYAGVKTISEGEEPNRRVVLWPK